MIRDITKSYKNITPQKSASSSFLLIILLMVFTPVLALVFGIRLLLIIPACLVLYLFFIYISGKLSAGITSATFALVTLYANIPIIESPGGNLNIFIFDPFLILLLIFGLAWNINEPMRSSVSGMVSIFIFCLFVLWSGLSVLVSNGVSNTTAFTFTVKQVRYAVIFIATFLYLNQNSIRNIIYPIFNGVVIQVLVAYAQIFNNERFGLARLGEGYNDPIGDIVVGPLTYDANQYVGGFTGNSRVLAAVLLLTLPICSILIINRFDKSIIGFGILSLFCALILTTNSLSANIAFVFLIICTIGLLKSQFNSETLILYIRTYTISGIALLPVFIVFVLSYTSNGALLTYIDNLETRMLQYKSALEIITQYPLFGIGGSNYDIVSNSYGVVPGRSMHNLFMSHLVGTGMIGVLLFVLSILYVYIHAYSNLATNNRGHNIVVISLLLGISSSLIYAFFTTIGEFTNFMSLFWVICGCVVGMIPDE